MMKQCVCAVLASAASLATAFTGGSCSSDDHVRRSTAAAATSATATRAPIRTTTPTYDPLYATSWRLLPVHRRHLLRSVRLHVRVRLRVAGGARPGRRSDDGQQRARAARQGAPRRQRGRRGRARRARSDQGADEDAADAERTTPSSTGRPATAAATTSSRCARLSASGEALRLEAGGAPGGSSGGFSRVAGGLIRVGEQPRRGRGAFGVDCDAMSAADSSVTCRGTLLIGFAHTDDGDKILNVAPAAAYTPDASAIMPLDATVFAWRRGRQREPRARWSTQTNLSGDGDVGAGDRRDQADLARGRRRARRCGGDRRRHPAGSDVHRQHLRRRRPRSVAG